MGGASTPELIVRRPRDGSGTEAEAAARGGWMGPGKPACAGSIPPNQAAGRHRGDDLLRRQPRERGDDRVNHSWGDGIRPRVPGDGLVCAVRPSPPGQVDLGRWWGVRVRRGPSKTLCIVEDFSPQVRPTTPWTPRSTVRLRAQRQQSKPRRIVAQRMKAELPPSHWPWLPPSLADGRVLRAGGIRIPRSTESSRIGVTHR